MVKGYGICLNEWIEDVRIKNELRLLIKISSLTADKGYCFASNEYFSGYFDIDTVTVSRQIKKLEQLGYLNIEYQKEGASIKKRFIRLTKMLTDDYQKSQSTINRNVKDNSTSINNTSINKKETKVSKKEIDFIYSLYPTTCPIKNRKLGKSTANKKKIKSRIKELGVSHLEKTINRYIQECKSANEWMKNFSSFLNELPDYEDVENNDLETIKSWIQGKEPLFKDRERLLGCKEYELQKDWHENHKDKEYQEILINHLKKKYSLD